MTIKFNKKIPEQYRDRLDSLSEEMAGNAQFIWAISSEFAPKQKIYSMLYDNLLITIEKIPIEDQI